MAEPRPANTEPFRFGVFEIDPSARELRKHGVRIKLQDQPLAVLLILLEKRGQLVTKEELQQRLWPADTFVEFDKGIYNAMKRLRETLGDGADTPRYIETVPRRGYRFIAPVERRHRTGERLQLPPTPESHPPSPSTKRLVSEIGVAARLTESSQSVPILEVARKPTFIVGALVLLTIACLSAGFLSRHYARIRWVREVAVPELEKLGLDRKGVAFYRLARQAERYSPNSPELRLAETKYLRSQSLVSTPTGADVYFREYGDSQGDWEYLGKTPLEGKFLWAEYAMRFVKDGYEPV